MLKRGGAAAHQAYLEERQFAFDTGEFEKTRAEVQHQHPHLSPEESAARAAFRLLTSSAAKAPLTGDFSLGAVTSAGPPPFHPMRCLTPLKIAWAIAILILLAVIAGLLLSALPARAEPDPPAPRPAGASGNAVSRDAEIRALLLRPPVLAQFGVQPVNVVLINGAQPHLTGTSLDVNCASGCGAASNFTDNSAFTVGTTAINPIGGYYATGADPSISSGNAGRARIDSHSYLFVDCVVGCSGGSTTPADTFANPTTAGLQFNLLAGFNGTTWDRLRSGDVNNAASAAGLLNAGIVGRYDSTQPTLTTAHYDFAQLSSRGEVFIAKGVSGFSIDNTGFNATLQASAGTDIGKLDADQTVNLDQVHGTATDVNSGNKSNGTLRVVLATDQPALTNAQPVNVAQVNGAATSTAASGTQLVGITGHAGGNVDGATGAAPPANVIFIGGLALGATRGLLQSFAACDTYKNINISTATTTLIVTGVSGRQVRICAQHMIAAAADNVAWIEGTGATCGTGTAGMAGGTTAASGYNFAANGGIAEGSGLGSVLETVTAGDSICLVTSASVQLSGGIKYA